MSNFPLKDKTIVFTGTKKSTTVFDKITKLGGVPVYLPLIQTKELLDEHDEQKLQQALNFDWLIFTSQNAVKFFCEKVNRYQLSSKDFKAKIAAVGDKTKELLQKNGFVVDFLPTVFSADEFIKEFPTSDTESYLFLRGNLAKDTLKEGIPNLQQWTVYETVENRKSINPLIQIIEQSNEVIVVFASPSAVDVFALHIAKKVGWDKVKLASIGHVTTGKIKLYGQKVTYQPKVYTMGSIVEEIIIREDVLNDRTKF